MLRITVRLQILLALAALAIGLGGCAAPAERAAMTPQNLSINKHYAASLAVQTSGGAQTGVMDSSNVADADLQAAIETAVRQSQIFKSIVHGNEADYSLTVRLVSLSKPIFGASFTVDMETAWSLIKNSDRSVVMRQSVKSSGTASMGDALAGVTRLRLAVEAATRDNIARGLQAIAELNL